MQFLCNPENITPRLKYTVDFIFSTIGFSIEIISTKMFKKSKDLVVGYLNQKEIQSLKNINLINITNFDELNNLEQFEKKIEVIKANSENIPVLGTTFQNDLKSEWKKSKKENFFYSNNSKVCA